MSAATGVHGGADRRAGSRRLVDELVEERRRMFVLYEQAAGVAPFPAGHSHDQVLARFNEVMTDYIAAGHFALYRRIAEGDERRRDLAELAVDLYPRIAATTDAAMAFSDGLGRRGADGLDRELASLGEHLAVRVELEDQLIEAMLQRE